MTTGKNCDHYWTVTEYLPMDAILDYWCNDGMQCRNAKKHAIIAGCEQNKIEYSRSDGKTFNDTVAELVQKNILLIHRESFEKWAKAIDEQIPDLPITSSARKSLLAMVYGMAVKHYHYDPTDLKSIVPAQIVNDVVTVDLSITNETVLKWLREAASLTKSKG